MNNSHTSDGNRIISDVVSLTPIPPGIDDPSAYQFLANSYPDWRNIAFFDLSNLDTKTFGTWAEEVATAQNFNGKTFDIDYARRAIESRSVCVPGTSAPQISHLFSMGSNYVWGYANLNGLPVMYFIIGNVPIVQASYFPTLRACVIASAKAEAFVRNAVFCLDCHIAVNPRLFSDYLRSPIETVSIVVANPHVGHHLWDELGGLDFLRASGHLRQIDRVHIRPCATETYHRVEDIFPDLDGKVHRHKQEWDLASAALSDHEFTVPYGGRYVSGHLAERIAALSKTASASFVDAIERDSQGSALKLLIGLRLENRCWIDQQDGYVRIIEHLAQTFGSIAVVFDGHNSSIDESQGAIRSYGERGSPQTTGEDMSCVGQETALVANVRAAIAARGLGERVFITDTLSMPVAHSVVAAIWCDFFLSHWGAGLAKYKWIANKPGMIITNNAMLARSAKKSSDLFLYDTERNREDASSSAYISIDMVEDVPGTEHQLVKLEGSSFHCFRVDMDRFVPFLSDWATDNFKVSGADLGTRRQLA